MREHFAKISSRAQLLLSTLKRFHYSKSFRYIFLEARASHRAGLSITRCVCMSVIKLEPELKLNLKSIEKTDEPDYLCFGTGVS